MTETKSVQLNDLDARNALFRSVLIRGGVALIFGLLVFILNSFGDYANNPAWLNFSIAGYLIFTGVALWEFLRQEPVPVEMRSPVSMAAAATVIGTVVLIGVFLFDGGAAITAVVTGIVLVLMGVAELVAWAGQRGKFAPARDYLLTGIIDVLTGIATIAALGVDGRWILGTVGTGALLIAIIWLISGIGYYLDVRRAIRRGWEPSDA